MNEITLEDARLVMPSNTLGDAVRVIRNNPRQFVKSWNYKGAVLSGFLRAPIFFVTYLLGRESLKLAFGAATLQFIFRFFFAGVGGTIIQSFRRVEPVWKALLAILLLLPLVSHIVEYLLQAAFAYVTSTQDHTDEAILRSITVSIISALFTLFAMRRNVMIVGDEDSRSLLHDISRLPVLIVEFVAFIPNEISAMARRGAFLTVAIAFAAFGIFSEIMLAAVTNRFYWTYSGGRSISLIKYWGVDGIIVLLLAVMLSSYVYNRGRARTRA